MGRLQAVYVPADDFRDPAAVHTFDHLSAPVVLSRKRASEGCILPYDLLWSGSKMVTPQIFSPRHYRIAQEIVAMLGLEELSREDRQTVQRARCLERFLTEPFFVTEQFAGVEAGSCTLADCGTWRDSPFNALDIIAAFEALGEKEK